MYVAIFIVDSAEAIVGFISQRKDYRVYIRSTLGFLGLLIMGGGA